MSLSEATRQRISDLVTKHQVLLFMKGNRQFPQCGFSARVVRILDALLPAYEAVNVLADSELREGVKEFSNWPTLPQLYIAGQFVGGCDIVTELHRSGQLRDMIDKDTAAVPTASPPPAIGLRITDRAARKLRATSADEAQAPHLRISPEYGYSFYFSAIGPEDTEIVSNGVSLWVDRDSLSRLDGTTLDAPETHEGGGYLIENPREPPRVRSMRPKELKTLLDAGAPLQVVDVRTEAERAIARIQGSMTVDDGEAGIRSLDRNVPVVVYCHHGIRSRAAAERLLRAGHRDVYNLDGGIDSWAMDIDPSMVRY